ncbi:MAG TPA: 3-phosphoserine/phosphohydroxythreonine transaminase [Phycisphaerales bacterium]|nr:3-phosphoserine/phosphohydroxythreonine transaminase [Phycisphaerales bacterium]HMP36608.1 3-phosphoserine/phosphohydroxythreonine transaminase [Phycisphaerales bacterium]
MTSVALPPATASTTTAGHRVFNFSAGPAAIPESVLEEARRDLIDIAGTGIGILEHSHRGALFDRVLHEALADCRELGKIPPSHEILFISGGATLQFAMVPLNFLEPGRSADYLATGVWAQKAAVEARHVAALTGGSVRIAFDGRRHRYDHVPEPAELDLDPHAAYAHYCSNNTVYATRFAAPPPARVPLICDASSDIFSRRHDDPWRFGSHALVYASGQKNLGPSGMVLVIADRAFLGSARRGLPSLLDYRAYVAGESRPSTPNTWGIYLMGRMFRWMLAEGGLDALAARNEAKAALLYDVIDAGFYVGMARRESRSLMNVGFRLPSEALEERFATEAAQAGLDGLRGHRESGGLRASIYNAMPVEGCRRLAEFMRDFAARLG